MSGLEPNDYDDEEGNYVFLNNKKIFKRTMWSKNGAEFLNGATLVLDASFGYYQTPIQKNVYFVAEDTLIFLSGKHIIEYDIIRKKESYILKNLDDESIVAMNYYMNKKKALSVAVAMRSTSRVLPQVKIYSKAKNFSYSLVHSHLSPSSTILDISFFIKSKYLLSLSESDKKHQISVWSISKEKCVTYIDIDEQLTKISLCPTSMDDFLLMGKNYMKLWTFNAQSKSLTLKNLEPPKAIQNNSSDHCWLNSAPYLIITDLENNIFLLKNFEVIRSYKLSLTQKDIDNAFSSNMEEKSKRVVPSQAKEVECYINCVCPTARGFACGIGGVGIISLFEIDKHEQIIHKGNFRIRDEQINRIHSLHTSPDDMYIAVSIIYNARTNLNYHDDSNEKKAEEEKNQVKEIGKLEISIFNIAVVDAIRTAYKDPFEPLFEKGVHKGSILNISACPSKSIFVSLGEEKYAKFWEYGQEFKGIFSHYFHEIPLCLSLHPLGIQCAVGFREGVRVFYVLDDELRPIYHDSSTRSCNAMNYSDGGNLLAAGNYNLINIYNSYTFEKLAVFNGHSGPLKELLWSTNDTILISSCHQGLLNTWLVSKIEHVIEHAANKQIKYNAVTYDVEWDLVVACCSDSRLRIFAERGVTQVFEYDTSPYQFTAVFICKKLNVIFFGTNAGSIRVYLWPIYDFSNSALEFIEFPIHQGPVTNIKVTADFMYLITASEDSSIFMSRVREYADGHDISALDMMATLNKQKNKDFAGKVTNAFSLNSFCLTSKTSHEAKKEKIKELVFKITNLRGEIEDDKEKLLSTYNQRIKTLEEKNRDALSKQKDLMKQKMEEVDRNGRKLQDLLDSQRRDFREQKKNCDEANCEDLKDCYRQNDVLRDEIESLKQKFSKEKEGHREEYNKTLKEVESEYQSKYQELYNRFSSALLNMKQDQKKFDEVFIQSEEEFERFLEKTKQKLQKELEEEESISETLRSQNSKLDKENEKLNERLMQLDTLIKDTKAQINHLEEQKLNFSEKIKTMLRQLEEREKTINVKEEQIKEFRSKNIHLQNFRAVYDYRVNTLKDERTPLLDHLENMDKHVKMMYKELLEEAGGNKNLDEKIGDNESKIKLLKKNLKQKNDILSFTKRQIENFEYQITTLMKNYKYEDWLSKLNEIFTENFESNSKIEAFIQKGSSIGASIRELQKDSLLESLEKNIHEAIKDELIRYRDFMSKKLITMTKVNKRIEGDRDEIFLKIQNENTNLIIECNRLRKLRHEIKNSLGALQKQIKELTRDLATIAHELNESLSAEESEEIEDPRSLIEKNNNQQRIIQSKIKTELPYVKYVNDKKAKMAIRRGSSSPEKPDNNGKLFDLLMNEMDKYKIEEDGQGELIERLREKVHNFLYSEESSLETSQNNISLPNIKPNSNNSQRLVESERKLAKNIGSPNKNFKLNGANIVLTPQNNK